MVFCHMIVIVRKYHIERGTIMFCPKCGTEVTERSKYCSGCGHHMQKSTSKLLIFMFSLMALIVATIGIFLVILLTESQSTKEKLASKEKPVEQTKVVTKSEITPEPVVKEKLTEPPKDVSEIINISQPKVFTVFTELGQGSGFLINQHGDVLTNAHVVEGSLNPIITTIDGNEFQGTLIGYSNTTDIALIRVPDLGNREPMPLETTPAEIGDEVIALGSPQGFENTATLGNISGVDRTFVIEPFQYDGIYQTSAAISPGSSGGPLVSKSNGKVLAINSARHTTEVNIGFSIPIYQIIDTVNQWVDSPLTQEEIISLFYYQDGVYYYQDYLDDYGYFEDGIYNDDYIEYYEIPYEESWYDYFNYWSDDYGTNDYYYNGDDDDRTDETYGGYEKTEGSNDYDGNQGNGGAAESDDVENNEGMEVEETPELGEDSTINEESESESIQEGYGDSNPDSFPTEEEVEL